MQRDNLVGWNAANSEQSICAITDLRIVLHYLQKPD